jgi:hypothetical protein
VGESRLRLGITELDGETRELGLGQEMQNNRLILVWVRLFMFQSALPLHIYRGGGLDPSTSRNPRRSQFGTQQIDV